MMARMLRFFDALIGRRAVVTLAIGLTLATIGFSIAPTITAWVYLISALVGVPIYVYLWPALTFNDRALKRDGE